MIFKRKLRCSFCRRTDAEVEKLVAGPRVYICDRCAAEAVRIMNEPVDPQPCDREGPWVARKNLA
jgi:ATP-dependent Clp protease ATP-binding subunit ClpX